MYKFRPGIKDFSYSFPIAVYSYLRYDKRDKLNSEKLGGLL